MVRGNSDSKNINRKKISTGTKVALCAYLTFNNF